MRRLNVAEVVPEVYEGLVQVERAIRKGSLDPLIRELVKIRASQMNGCLFCIDMHVHEALQIGETQDRVFQVSAWRESKLFTDAERAALAYTEAATRQPDQVPDDVWEAVTANFRQEDAGMLVAQVAQINMWNRIAAPTHARPPHRPGPKRS